MEALRESEARYRELFATVSDAIVLLDAETERCIDANDAALALYGYTRAEFLQLRPWDISADSEMPGLSVDQTSTRERSRTPIYHHRKKDGTVFPVEISASRFMLSNREVVCGVIRDITERQQAEEQLRASREQLRALAARLESVREEERTRIAREIHDELGHILTTLKMDLLWLDRRISNVGDMRLRSLLEGEIGTMIDMLDGTIERVGRIASELRPGVLDDLGLTAAIEWQAYEFERRTDIVCRFVGPPGDVAPSSECSTALFRIFQEILTNVARHAEATRVEIRLDQKAEDVVLEVRDNGRGITERELSDPSSLGILGMRERALAFGGELHIAGVRVKGTTVTVRMPVGDPSSAEAEGSASRINQTL